MAPLELGDPRRLAADYSNRPLKLIGANHYPTYIRLLKVSTATVLPIADAGVIISNLLTGADAGEIATKAITTLFELTIQLISRTTLVFVIIERTRHPSPCTRPGIHQPCRTCRRERY